MGFVVDAAAGLLGVDGGDAAAASQHAANIQAEGQREALEYLKETEALPQQFRESALTRLGGLFGLPGGEGSQADLITRAKSSPLYQAILGTREAGEDAILRSASATGGLRSGNVQRALFDENQRLEERALLSAYDEQKAGLTGLAGLPSRASEIAQATAAPSATRAAGITAGARAEQAGRAGMMQGLFSLGGAGLLALCDARLKTNVRPAGERFGHKWYTWDWNEKAAELGLTGPSEGVMAHEVAEKNPEIVGVGKTGYLMVDYGAMI